MGVKRVRVDTTAKRRLLAFSGTPFINQKFDLIVILTS